MFSKKRVNATARSQGKQLLAMWWTLQVWSNNLMELDSRYTNGGIYPVILPGRNKVHSRKVINNANEQKNMQIRFIP